MSVEICSHRIGIDEPCEDCGRKKAKPHGGLNIVQQIHIIEPPRRPELPPCLEYGHRAAYLVAGGIACGVCGMPMG
jgi:hypothetical protein